MKKATTWTLLIEQILQEEKGCNPRDLAAVVMDYLEADLSEEDCHQLDLIEENLAVTIARHHKKQQPGADDTTGLAQLIYNQLKAFFVPPEDEMSDCY